MSSRQKGLTLLEVLIAVFVLAVLTLAIVGLLTLGLRSLTFNETRTVAQGLVNQELERLRALPYDDIGYDSGTPDGVLSATQTISQNGQEYVLNYDIELIDDPNNGTVSGSLTEANADYKKIAVEVLLPGDSGQQHSVVSSTLSVPGDLTGASSFSGLINHWQVESGNPTTVFDNVGGNHGTLFGGAYGNGDTPPLLSTSTLSVGINATAGSYIQTTSDIDFGEGDYSISLWLKYNGPDDTILGNLYDSTRYINVVDPSTIEIEDGSGFPLYYYFASPMVTDQWYHLAIVRSGTSISAYIDNASGGTQSATTNSFLLNNFGQRFDGSCCTGNFSGLLDDIRYYNIALTAQQISNLAAGLDEDGNDI